MREILFRGKNIKTGKWEYGFYVFIASTHYIVQPDACIGYDDITDTYEVIPETVGEFTGLLDRDGKKIFEGDILKSPIEYLSKKHGHQIVVTDIRECNFMAFYATKYIVVGNVHDNPKLSEV